MTITDNDREAGWAAMRAADHAHGLDAKAECYAEAIATARAEEREACAALCEALGEREESDDFHRACRWVASDIRARGED